MAGEPGEVTVLLSKIRSGDRVAQERLAELIYFELRRLAYGKMRAERPNHTLTPTALVHEAWMQLRENEDFQDRKHFLGVASAAMRRVLIDHARSRNAIKRKATLVNLEGIDIAGPDSDEQLLAIDEALNRLSGVSARAANVVELRFFGGLTHDEIAALLEVERRTIDRDWAMARAWLFKQITGTPESI